MDADGGKVYLKAWDSAAETIKRGGWKGSTCQRIKGRTGQSHVLI